MPDLVVEGAEYSCNFCPSSKLKLKVMSSSSTSAGKKMANQTNCMFPPPGGNCTFPPGAPPTPCPGIPPGMNIAAGQSTVKVDNVTALGDGSKFICAKGQIVTLSKAGQKVTKHDEASGDDDSFDAALLLQAIPDLIMILASKGKVKGNVLKRLGPALKKSAQKAGTAIKNAAIKAKNKVKSLFGKSSPKETLKASQRNKPNSTPQSNLQAPKVPPENVPDRPLPRTKDGIPIPDKNEPHIQWGTKEGRKGKYVQAREFGHNGPTDTRYRLH